jgi:hypothetical protein
MAMNRISTKSPQIAALLKRAIPRDAQKIMLQACSSAVDYAALDADVVREALELLVRGEHADERTGTEGSCSFGVGSSA